jgi:hypothetical protein
MTARPYFLRGYTDEWANTQPAITPLAEPAQEDTGLLMHLHRVTRVPVNDAANDHDAEDELVQSMFALDLMAIAFFVVFAIALSIYKPWQWFGPMDLEGTYQATVAAISGVFQ